MPDGFVQTNVNLTDDDVRKMDFMMREVGLDNRSGYVRMLIRNEWARRYSKPNPGISVMDAIAASDPQNPA